MKTQKIQGRMQALFPDFICIFARLIALRVYPYSTMDATVPDPTVRPPSRYQTDVLEYLKRVF